MRGGDESDRASCAVRVHRAERIGEERMPVPHAHVHWQRVSGGGQATLQSGGLPHGDLGERRHAVEELVVVRYFLDALRRHAPAAEDIGEKWTDIVAPARSAEG